MKNTTDLWSFKYHPKTFDDMILSPNMRKLLSNVYNNMPNITLSGPPGIGKSTFVDILVKNKKLECLRINASDETGIDSIRNRVKIFAQGVNVDADVLKVVYLNECDSMSPQALKMLRDLIEQVIDITRFILVCNYPEKIIPEIFSRCPLIEFGNPPIKELAAKCKHILDAEGVEYDLKNVISLVKMTGTDVRHTINTLQLNVFDGKLNGAIVVKSVNEVFDNIIESMMSGNPANVRVALRSGAVDYTRLYDSLYNRLLDSENDVFKNDSSALLLITEAAYRNEFVAIKEINFMNMYLKFMKEGIV